MKRWRMVGGGVWRSLGSRRAKGLTLKASEPEGPVCLETPAALISLEAERGVGGETAGDDVSGASASELKDGRPLALIPQTTPS
jgi:hypothetical protein